MDLFTEALQFLQEKHITQRTFSLGEAAHLMAEFAKDKLEEKSTSTPPAEGTEKVQRCPVCMGKGLVPNSFYATTSGIGSTTQTYLPEKCHTCNGAGVILPSYLQKQQQPTAEGAEEMLEEVMVENGFTYVSFPAFVENESSVDVFDIAVKAIKRFATLHAQKLAEKKVSERLREELIKYDQYYWGQRGNSESEVDEYLKTREP